MGVRKWIHKLKKKRKINAYLRSYLLKLICFKIKQYKLNKFIQLIYYSFLFIYNCKLKLAMLYE